MTLEFHPLASVFPLMEGEEFSALVEDVRANGVLEPVTLYEDKILDGRNRARAAEQAGVSFATSDYVGADPLGFVISLNMHRRHLSDSQRAMVAEALTRIRQEDETPHGGITQNAAASALHVKKRSIQRAAVVRRDGIPELAKAVEAGKLQVATAAQATELSPDEQRVILASADPVKAVQQAIKRQHRQLREIELAGKQQDMPTEKFAVIYADCPWRFEPRSRETGMDRAADNHYPTEDIEALCAMQVPAADDSVCFFWATRAMLQQALRVLEAWGFAYKTCAVWKKPCMGTGYWFRDNAELLLLGVRGEVPAPAMGDQFLACFDAPKGKHSSKPEFVRHIIDSYFPHLSKLELFARGEPPEGWRFWGLEAESKSASGNAEAESSAAGEELDPQPQGEPAVANGNGEDDPFASLKSIKRVPRSEAPEIPAILDRRAKRGVERATD